MQPRCTEALGSQERQNLLRDYRYVLSLFSDLDGWLGKLVTYNCQCWSAQYKAKTPHSMEALGSFLVTQQTKLQLIRTSSNIHLPLDHPPIPSKLRIQHSQVLRLPPSLRIKIQTRQEFSRRTRSMVHSYDFKTLPKPITVDMLPLILKNSDLGDFTTRSM